MSKIFVDGLTLKSTEGSKITLQGCNGDINFTESDIKWLKDSGFTSVRLIFNWGLAEPSKGAYDSAYWAKVDTIINLCNTYNIYVILDDGVAELESSVTFLKGKIDSARLALSY